MQRGQRNDVSIISCVVVLGFRQPQHLPSSLSPPGRGTFTIEDSLKRTVPEGIALAAMSDRFLKGRTSTLTNDDELRVAEIEDFLVGRVEDDD